MKAIAEMLTKSVLFVAFVMALNTSANVTISCSVDGKSLVQAGARVTYFANVSGGSGTITYQWQTTAGTIENGNSRRCTVTVPGPTPTVPPQAPAPFTVTCYVTREGCNASDSKTVTVRIWASRNRRTSAGARYINYAAPRTKGGDADAGASPSAYPQVAVDNVSMTPGASHALFSVNTPAGAFDFSPVLSYAPPVFGKSHTFTSGGALNGTTYSIAAMPSAVGACWSANFVPCLARSATRIVVIGATDYLYEFSATLSGGPTPSASFNGGAATYQDPDPAAPPNAWVPEPLSRATLASDGGFWFWGSGVAGTTAGAKSAVDSEIDTSQMLNARTRYDWLASVTDRNGNAMRFWYENDARSVNGSANIAIESATDTKIKPGYFLVPLCLSNTVSPTSVRCTSTSAGIVTNVALYRDDTRVRDVTLTYRQYTIAHNGQSLIANMLTNVVLPNNHSVAYEYTLVAPPPALTDPIHGMQFSSVPWLSKVITRADTTYILYEDFGWFGPEDNQQWLPRAVMIIANSNCSTQRFERPADFAGDLTMTTYSETETCNQKTYRVLFDAAFNQWYGCETTNVLDGALQHSYGLDERYRYIAATAHPLGSDGPSHDAAFEYDGWDNVSREVDALGNVTTYTYQHNGLDLERSVDPRGVVTLHHYDAKGNRTKTIEDYGTGKLNRAQSNEYNIAGQLIKSHDALDRVTRHFYSINRLAQPISSYDNEEPTLTDAGFLVATRDALDRVTTYSYDVLGRKIIENAPGNADDARYQVTHTYDIMDRLTSTMYPDDTYTSNIYNAAGYPVRVRDRMGRETTNTWDAAGHLVSVLYPNGDWVTKTYMGNLVTKVMDAAGNMTEYFYCHEQLTGVRFPDGSTRAAGFDNLNCQIWAVDERGVAVTNAYDKLNRLIASVYVPFSPSLDLPPDVTSLSGVTPAMCNTAAIYGGFDNQCIHSTHDELGNLLSMTDWAGTITNAYDALNRPSFIDTRFAALPTLAYSLAQTFDLADNRLSMVMAAPHDYVQTSFAYDMLNRLTTNTAWTLGKTVLGAYAYNPNGKLASRTASFNGNDAGTLALSYDSEQRLQNISANYSGQSLLSLTYGYNNAQQITAIQETLEDTTVQCGYSYDARDQLVSETRDASVRSYAYDRAQNRITNSAAGTAETYGYTVANKLSNVFTGVAGANNRYFYDRAGNLQYRVVNNVTNWYDYNAQNKLARIRGGGFTNEFLYDSLNRRIALCQNGSWRYEAHDGAVPVGSFHASRILTRWFVRGVGIAEGTGDVIAEVDMSDRCPEPCFYFSNHRGDTQLCLDGYGDVIAKYRYDAFGNVSKYTGTFAPRYTFSTKEYLSDAQLYLYAYRVYDPIAGRWTQRDPIEYQDSMNLYQFCGNNAVNKTDADGREAAIVGAALLMYGSFRIAFATYSVNFGRDYAVTPFRYLGIVITGENYKKLSDVGKAVVDHHEEYHRVNGTLPHTEIVAHQNSIEVIDAILDSGTWDGKKLDDKSRWDLYKLRGLSVDQLRDRMGDDEYDKWQNSRARNKPRKKHD